MSSNQECVAAGKRTVPSHAHQAKLRDMLISDNPNLSDPDFHHGNTRRLDNAAPTHTHRRKSPVLDKMTPKEDELVKYMSNLPSFLEKGKNFQEKALNFGVLDWKRLEQWRHSKKQMPHKHNECSISSSNTSLFSRDSSSTSSSRGPSCSPSNQRMHRLSLQLPLEASPENVKCSSGRGHSCSPVPQREHDHVLPSHPQKLYDREEKSQDIDVLRGNTGKIQDPNCGSDYCSSRQQKVLGPSQQHDRKSHDLKFSSEMGQQIVFDKFEAVQRASIEKNKSKKGLLKSQKTKLNAADHDCSGIEQSGGLVMPRDQSEITTSYYFTANDRFSVERMPKNITRRKSHENPLYFQADGGEYSVGFGSQDLKGIESPSKTLVQTGKSFHNTSRSSTQCVRGHSQVSHKFSIPATRMLSSPSTRRNMDEKKLIAEIVSSTTAASPSEELDVRRNSYSIPKSRHPSPVRRLSFAMGKMIKNTGSRDNSPLRSSSSKDCLAKSRSDEAVAPASIYNPCGDKSSGNNHNGGRSSPLRSLLDPFLKSKGSNSSEPSKKHSSAAVSTGKSYSDPKDFCNSMKLKSRSSNDSSMSASDPRLCSKNELSSLQALLQVSLKNGFPLFTFAIDNETDVLAATVRKTFVPSKGHHNCTYTFFTVREIKRKSGIWLNKGDSHGYVPTVVAQMKVSDSQDLSFDKYENEESHVTREFNLLAVDVGHDNQYATDICPTNELAAIIAKLPRRFRKDHSKNEQFKYDWLNMSNSCLTDAAQAMRSCADSDDDFQSTHNTEGLNFNTTVILPGGVHTVPNKGEISTLVHRWRSGGSCDCGGWDLGCQLLVYTNQRDYEKKSSSSVTFQKKDMLQLFPLGGPDSKPMLRLAPFKEKIYSVEFCSSLSLLQAFAICISFLDCRRPAEVPESNSTLVDSITDEIGIFEIPNQPKTLNQVDAPGRYVSCPPHSPVGRV